MKTEETLRPIRKIEEVLGFPEGFHVVGSVRRKSPMVNDIDILVETKRIVTTREFNKKLRTFILKYNGNIFAEGLQKFRFMVGDVQFDVNYLYSGEHLGCALLHHTGSSRNNMAMRKIAKNKGLKLNEKGLWKGTKMLLEDSSELAVYEALGLEYQAPQNRNGKVKFK